MLERLWAAARDEILDSPTVEKFYLTLGSGKTILRINRDPRVVKEILREQLKVSKQQQQEKQLQLGR